MCQEGAISIVWNFEHFSSISYNLFAVLVSDTEFLLDLSRVKFNQNYGQYSIWVCLLLISQEHCCRVRDSPDELNSSTLFHVRLMICINFLWVIHHAWEKKKTADNKQC